MEGGGGGATPHPRGDGTTFGVQLEWEGMQNTEANLLFWRAISLIFYLSNF